MKLLLCAFPFEVVSKSLEIQLNAKYLRFSVVCSQTLSYPVASNRYATYVNQLFNNIELMAQSDNKVPSIIA